MFDRVWLISGRGGVERVHCIRRDELRYINMADGDSERLQDYHILNQKAIESALDSDVRVHGRWVILKDGNRCDLSPLKLEPSAVGIQRQEHVAERLRRVIHRRKWLLVTLAKKPFVHEEAVLRARFSKS